MGIPRPDVGFLHRMLVDNYKPEKPASESVTEGKKHKQSSNPDSSPDQVVSQGGSSNNGEYGNRLIKSDYSLLKIFSGTGTIAATGAM
jgi:hypothetical protein